MMTVMAVVFSTFLGNRRCCELSFVSYLGNTAFQLMNDAPLWECAQLLMHLLLLRRPCTIALFSCSEGAFAVVNHLFAHCCWALLRLSSAFRWIGSLLTLILLACFCIGLAMLLSALAAPLETLSTVERCNHRLMYGRLFTRCSYQSLWRPD